jgi:hypothetical protein
VIVGKELGVSPDTLYKWVVKETHLRAEFLLRATNVVGKRNKSKHIRRLGKPGRVAVFAMVETELARDIRRIRDENRSYPTKRVMPEYKKRALVVADASCPDLRAVFDKMVLDPGY